jgi:hypothetical protein
MNMHNVYESGCGVKRNKDQCLSRTLCRRGLFIHLFWSCLDFRATVPNTSSDSMATISDSAIVKVPPELDIVRGKFAVLNIVHSEHLILKASPELETRDEVNSLGNKGGDDEGIGASGDNIGNLDVKLLPVAVEPATRDNGNTVQGGETSLGKESIDDETDDTTDGVLSEEIESIIHAKETLD